jgi:3-oxoacyl-[acyl-carrier-protein] synthase III
MIRSRIVGTGRYVPDQVVTNADIAARGVDTNDEWIRSRTGIGQRHMLEAGRGTSDMAAAAGRAACEAAGIAPSEIDALIVATTSADMPMPSCAILTQHKLGARCVAFDVAAACAGFSHGLVVADSMVRCGSYNKVLFIGADALSRYLNWDDRGTCILFGDGAGAVVLVGDQDQPPATSKSARGILATHLGSDGSRWGDLNVLGGGSLHGTSPQTIDDKLHYLRMNGRVIFSHAVRHLSESSARVLEMAGLGADDVDLVIPHQANLRIIDAVARRLMIPRDKFVTNIERYGNTSAASIPIALDEVVREGRLRSKMTFLMCGLGAGLTWGAAVARW